MLCGVGGRRSQKEMGDKKHSPGGSGNLAGVQRVESDVVGLANKSNLVTHSWNPPRVVGKCCFKRKHDTHPKRTRNTASVSRMIGRRARSASSIK